MSSNLYVGNLSYTATDTALRTAFAQFGQVESVTIVADRETGRSRGFGFVEMADGADAAIEGLNGTELQGRMLTVNQARPRNESAGGGRHHRDR